MIEKRQKTRQTNNKNVGTLPLMTNQPTLLSASYMASAFGNAAFLQDIYLFS